MLPRANRVGCINADYLQMVCKHDAERGSTPCMSTTFHRTDSAPKAKLLEQRNEAAYRANRIREIAHRELEYRRTQPSPA